MLYVLIFQGKNAYTNARQCCFIRTFPLLLIIDFPSNNLVSSFIVRNSCHLFRYLGHTAKTRRRNLHIPDVLQLLKPTKCVWPNNHAKLAKRELALVTIQSTIFCSLNDN